MKKPFILKGTLAALWFPAIGLLIPHLARGDTMYWDASPGGIAWKTNTNWSTTSGSDTPNPAMFPGTGDTAAFNVASSSTTIGLDGGVTINTVNFASAAASAYTIGSGGVNNQTLTFDASGTILMGSAVAHDESFNAKVILSGDASFTNKSSTNSLVFAGNITSTTAGLKNLAVDGAGDVTIIGNLDNSSGTVALTKMGSGTLTLQGANSSYGGGTTVNAGTLVLSGGAMLGAASGGLTVNGETAVVDLGTTSQTVGAVTLMDGAAINNGTLTGTSFAVQGGSIAASLAGNGTTLTKTTGGTVTLSGSNSYTGDTIISAGTLQLGASGVIPRGVGAGNVSVTGTLDLNGFNQTVNGLTGGGTVDDVAGGGTSTLTVGGNNQSSTFSGMIMNTNGTVGLTKTGTGTITLSGISTYTGTTRVTGGVLQLDGANRISSSSALTLNGGTLELANAGAPNGQTFASLTLSGNSTIDLDSTTSLTFNGLGAITTGKILSILDYSDTASPDYAIRFLGNYSSNADFLSLISDMTVDGVAADFRFDGVFTDVVATPEPTGLLTGLLCLGVAGMRRRAR